MAFTIPNLAAASVRDQAGPDSVDFDILTAGIQGDGVVSGLVVTEDSPVSLTVDYSAGTFVIASTVVTIIAGSVTATAADPTDPRFDLVVVNSGGTVSVVAGTPAAQNREFPDVPASSIALAALDIQPGATTIPTARIVAKGTLVHKPPILRDGSVAWAAQQTGALDLAGLFTASGHIQMAANGEIRDSGGTPRFTIATVKPHGTLDGDHLVDGRLTVRTAGVPLAGAGQTVLVHRAETIDAPISLIDALVDITGSFPAGSLECMTFNLIKRGGGDFSVIRGLSGSVTMFGGGAPLVMGSEAATIWEGAGSGAGGAARSYAARLWTRYVDDFSFTGSFGTDHGTLLIDEMEDFMIFGAALPSLANFRGVYIKNQAGLGVSAWLANATALDIAAQSGATTTLSMKVAGTAPIRFQPPAILGSSAVNPATSGLLDMISTTRTLILPRMTTAQRDAMTPVDGMMIYNTTTGVVEAREGGAWVNL